MEPPGLRRVVFVLAVIAGCGQAGPAALGGDDAAAPDAGGVGRWGDDVRLTHDPAESLLTPNFARTIAVGDTGAVHAVWFDTRDGAAQVYYKRSTDGGVSWGADRRLVLDGTERDNPAIAVAGARVYVSWQEYRQGGAFVALAVSSDGGNTWQAPITLGVANSAFSSLAAEGEQVHVVYGVVTGAVTEVWHRASYDGGATWSEAVQISDSPWDSWVPSVAMRGDLVLVNWVDYRDGNEEEYLRRSTDGGRTFGPLVRLTRDGGDSWAPSVAISGDVVHYLWFDRRDSTYDDVALEQGLDAIAAMVGAAVDPIPPRDPAVYYLDFFTDRLGMKLQAIQAAAPAWVHGGGDPAKLQAMIADFQAHLTSWTVSWEVYYKRSTDGGLTFGPDVRLTHAPYLSQRPSVVATGDRVDVVWFDGRDGAGRDDQDTEVYFKTSADGGQTWSGDLRLTRSPGASLRPSLAATPTHLHAIWYDTRDGNSEIYYKRLAR